MLLGIVVLVAAIMASTVFAVIVFVDRAERRKLRDDLERSQRVFAELLAYRRSIVRSDCRVVANEPRLRAVVGTQDTSHETIVGVISELKTSLASDLFLLTDSNGVLIGDANNPSATGVDLATNSVIAKAQKTGDGVGTWIITERPYQVHACRVDFGSQSVGVVLVGRAIDDEVAKVIYRQTGSTTVVELDGKAVAASHEGLSAIGAEVGIGPTEIELADSEYVGVGGGLPAYDGKRELRYTMVRSLADALAPARRLTRTVLASTGIALIVALVFAFIFSGRLSRPVASLVEFTRRIGKGELTARATPSGATEVRTLASAMNTMVGELELSRRSLAEKQRLEREMEIAMRIQTSMLPRHFAVPGLEIAARMLPAAEVGGDYYDILPVEDGCWIGIGDVAGHGLTAGLEMMMIQSVVAALVRRDPQATPTDQIRILNHVMFDNIHDRLRQDEHATFTLLRYRAGSLTFAGAHEDVVVLRASASACECVPTPGTWIGCMPDVTPVTKDTTLQLVFGDLVVLYTDGITEARAAGGEAFGLERVCRIVEANRGEPVEVIRDRITDAALAWLVDRDDDLSVVVIRIA
jgi:phosphoserine phosphatase RsbU/P